MKLSKLLINVALFFISASFVSAEEASVKTEIRNTLSVFVQAFAFADEEKFKNTVSPGFTIVDYNGEIESLEKALTQFPSRREGEFVKYESSLVTLKKINVKRRVAIVDAVWESSGFSVESEKSFSYKHSYMFVLVYDYSSRDRKTRKWFVLTAVRL